MSRLLQVFLLTVILVAPSASVVADSPTQLPFRVIVHPQNPVTSMERKALSDAFLKKLTLWGHQQTIRPVDLRPDSLVRQAFTEAILRRSVAAVKNYWQQLVFTGRDIPPPEVETDEHVVRFVLKHPGAVGYVSVNASLEGVKILQVK